jgi:hypothetical protein
MDKAELPKIKMHAFTRIVEDTSQFRKCCISDIEERYITYRQISYAICLQRKRRLLIQRLTLILNGPLALCNTLPLNHMHSCITLGITLSVCDVY